MTYKFQFKLGKNPLVIEACSEKELFESCGLFAQLPRVCGGCGSEDLMPCGLKSGGFDFYSIRCRACGCELKLGVRMADQRLFPKIEEGWHRPFQKNALQHENEI